MYLSRLLLNPRSTAVRHDLNNFQFMHRTIMKGFPETDSPSARSYYGVLYRVSVDYRKQIKLLIQSKMKPDWTSLPKNYLAPQSSSKNLAVRNMDSLLNQITEDSVFKFKLRANPTKNKQGKRVELYKEEDQYNWILRKAKDNGFLLPTYQGSPSIPAITVHPEGKQFGYQPISTNSRSNTHKQYRRITLFGVLYTGVLKVQDPNLIKRALEKGIGRGKSYGYGLLSIAPIQRK